MKLLRNLTEWITNYLVLYARVGAEIGRIAADFLRSRWRRFQSLPVTERLFALLSGATIIFTFLPWRSYRIQFTNSEARSHGIYSDDFAIILVGCIIALSVFFVFILPDEPKILRRAAWWRYTGVGIVAFFALWNWVDPLRMAASREASFTWSFYVFQATILCWALTGLAGGRFYATPQNPASA